MGISFKLVFKNTVLILVLLFFTLLSSCKAQNKNIVVAANQTQNYLPLLKNKRVAIVANQTSVIFKSDSSYTHLVDSLIHLKIDIQKVFSPEHGFRGKADAAEHVANGIDKKTNLPIISLYGNHKKPKTSDLKNLDVVVFDIQDVGVRFYTYISTLHYVMEACAENNIPLIVFDRPNPNAHYVDGPILNPNYSSFVGKHPIPLVYGMTIGEYAKMINGEKWLKEKVHCDLTVIKLKNYHHQLSYHLPIRPSPNLPNDKAINLYPSLGFFEGTPINAGRGTEHQFQQYGSSLFPKSDFSYVPKSNFGSKYPKDQNKKCYGVNLRETPKLNTVQIKWLIDAYQKYPKKESFFGKTFTIHAGDITLEKQIKSGLSAKEIQLSWKKDIEIFLKIRSKYLCY
ncbi:exo-beta-N-acetylmuramidase NamZ family protein [Wenyingzhuangia sp. IMCC45533]